MSAWRFFPYFLLRATGFAIERLTAVADAARDAPDITADERVRRERRALFDALSDARAREALLTSAPLVDRNLDGWRRHAEDGRRNSQDKKRERVLWRFLQRLTAKNDSTSFFGAVALGSFEREGGGAREVILPVEASRRVYTTQWVVERILERAVAEMRLAGAHRPVMRRAPGVDGEGRRWTPGGRGFSLADEGEALEVDIEALPSGLVDPVGEALARLEGEPESPLRDTWMASLRRLEAERDAFARSAGDPAARRAALAALESTCQALLGTAASRREGEFYASRGPVHEQADRTGTVIGLPSGWGESLRAAAAPFLELALLVQAPERAVMRRWFQRTFSAASAAEPVAWRDVLAAIAASPLQLELSAGPEVRAARELIKRIRQRMRAAVDDALAAAPGLSPPREVRLDPEDFAAEIAETLARLAPLGTAYANPDFMVALEGIEGDRSRPRFVLAEAHHLPCLTPCLIPSLAHEATLVDATRVFLVDLVAPELPAFPVSYDHSFISVGPDLGAVGLELSGLAKEPPERRATLSELAVHLDEGGVFRFTVPDHRGRRLAVVPLTRTARLHQAARVFPLSCPDLGAFLAGPEWRPLEAIPRLLYGELVVHRQRFSLAPDDLAAVATGRAQELLARRAGLDEAPRFMFARVASEPKPILIDWASGLAVELVAWSLKRGESFELSEMLPAPDALWLRSEFGHHTAELRAILRR